MKHRMLPSINSVVLCLLALLASARITAAQNKQADELEAVRRGLAYVEEKSLTWLHDRKCASCHHLPFMVWVQRDARARGLDHERQASIEELLTRQNTDGGWSQAKDMTSDAFATGQALYALVSRGGLVADHPAVVKAQYFLLTTQNPDGSWTMTSRSQHSDIPNKTSSGNLEPIIVSGSAWATLGLLQCIPDVGIPAKTIADK